MGLLVTFWLLAITEEQGTQFLAAFGAGVTALVTIKLILAAVRADERERLAADIRRSEQAS
jgi:hypothetical protein